MYVYVCSIYGLIVPLDLICTSKQADIQVTKELDLLQRIVQLKRNAIQSVVGGALGGGGGGGGGRGGDGGGGFLNLGGSAGGADGFLNLGQKTQGKEKGKLRGGTLHGDHRHSQDDELGGVLATCNRLPSITIKIAKMHRSIQLNPTNVKYLQIKKIEKKNVPNYKSSQRVACEISETHQHFASPKLLP
ncbi:hypothetical protein BSKO_06871 [Bryopsis sp. KO-2023]|nr:hypothetical protein BSKO_06871 [Bryopsis sp. KO-2023]